MVFFELPSDLNQVSRGRNETVVVEIYLEDRTEAQSGRVRLV